MSEIEKPFACTSEGCQKKFINEDHLNVHRKKHMVLNLPVPSKNLDAADQTPTPTRFIRNCEEVGLFQDLQNVNPFDETFKKAIQNGKCGSSYIPDISGDDTLHTPHIFPHIEGETNVQFTTTDHDIENQTHDFIINNVSSSDNSILKLDNKSKNESAVITSLLDTDDDDEDDSTENDFGDMQIKMDSNEVLRHFDIKQEVRDALKSKINVKKEKPKLKRAYFNNNDRNTRIENVPNKVQIRNRILNMNGIKLKPYNELSNIEKRRELNRAAQLRSRARKKQRVKDMENDMESLKVNYRDMNAKYEILKNENAALKMILLKHENCSISQDPSIIEETQKILNAAKIPPQLTETNTKGLRNKRNKPVLPVPKTLQCPPILLATIPTVQTTTVLKSVLRNDKVRNIKFISVPIITSNTGNSTNMSSSKRT